MDISSPRECLLAIAASLDLPLHPDHLPGVEANAALLHGYARLLHDFPLPDECEPAAEYHP